MKRRDFLGLMGAGMAAATAPSLAFAKSKLPAVPMSIPAELLDNPMLTFGKLPDYAAIRPEHMEPAVSFVSTWGKNAIIELCKQKSPTWDSFYRPLEDIDATANYPVSIARNINSVNNTPEFRKAYDAARKHRSEFSAWYDANEDVYRCLKALRDSREYKRYTHLQKQALKKSLWEFEKAGIGLPTDKKNRLAEINKELSELRTKFSNNIQDANKWSKTFTDLALLDGVPAENLEAAKRAAEKAGESGYRFDLSDASYWAIVNNATNKDVRETFFRASTVRCSDLSDDKHLDNTPIIKQILALRHEMANILGYKSFAEYTLVDRMADKPSEVMAFYQGLTQKIHAPATAQTEKLIAYGKDKLGIENPTAADFAYIAHKQKADLYQVNEDELRPYFPIDRVLEGMFEVNRRLFGIVTKEKKGVPAWHESVRFFEIFNEKGELLGSTYVDLYARPNKKSGAWKSNFINRRRDLNGKMVKPTTVLAANFTPPTDEGVALLTQKNVITLFHEFGHVVHHIIGDKIDIATISGTSGIPRDAVEFPSQLMEYWVWNKDVLPLFSGHYKTGEPLPKESIDKLVAVKDYLAARTAVRQAQYGLIDIRLHNEFNPSESNFVERIVSEVKTQLSLSEEPSYSRPINAFGHIFSSSYAAGYYGYLWSDVLSADVYSHFEKVGVFNRKEGQRYVDTFLGKGGSEDVMSMYVAFMGAKPNPAPLMKQFK